MVFRVLADLILVTHAAFIAFIVLGLVLILLGGVLGWRWVRNRWFRIAHLAGIGLVVFQAWFGIPCLLTVWENQLRFHAQQTTYTEGFIAHWLHRLIFFDAEPWVFTLCYTIFGLLVLATLWLVPIRWRRASS